MFDDMIADMESNKKLSVKVTELFLRGRKLSVLLVFVSQSYFKLPRTITLNATHYFIMKVPNKRELQQVASNPSSDIDFKDFMKLYKEYTQDTHFYWTMQLYHQITHYNLGRTYYKIDISEKIKAINNKIGQSKGQYNLDRQTAKISALLSGNISKYEYLTAKDVLLEKDLLEKAA